jgi:D-alanyl-D-alanine carboxypeptidase
MLIEQVTGSTVAEQYRRYIFEPLGLNDTYLCPGHTLPDDFAHGWFDLTGDGVYDDLASISSTSWCTMAGGAVYSTSADLARLANALMHERTILADASYDHMKDFYFPVGHDEPMVHGYGLGLVWFNRDFLFGREVWGHTGNAIGYAAGSLYLIDYGVSVGIMDNTEHGLAMQVLDGIFDVIVEFMENG